jgi:hypothetical protein
VVRVVRVVRVILQKCLGISKKGLAKGPKKSAQQNHKKALTTLTTLTSPVTTRVLAGQGYQFGQGLTLSTLTSPVTARVLLLRMGSRCGIEGVNRAPA